LNKEFSVTYSGKGKLLSREEAQEIWAMAMDPDAFPDWTEDRIHKNYEYAAEEVFMAYVAGKLKEAT